MRKVAHLREGSTILRRGFKSKGVSLYYCHSDKGGDAPILVMSVRGALIGVTRG